MFSILFIILLVIFFINLDSRIRKLQSQVDEYRRQLSLGAQANQSPQTQVPTGALTSKVASPVPGDGPVSQNVPLSQGVARPVIKTEKVNSEEASGRWLGKLGIGAIVLGISFFLKWTFDNDIIGQAGRVALGIIGGLALIGLGQWLRKKFLVYADILMGGGIAILYLTIFAAFQFYHIITSQPVAFGFMFLITVLSAVLSILGGTKNLAVLGVLGGFLTPFLLSTGQDNFVGLMTYTLLIDIGILAVVTFKRWIGLSYLGFIGTAIIFLSWYERFYKSELLFVTSLFLTLFFVVYLVTSVVHTILWKRLSSSADLGLTTINAAGYSFLMFVMLDPKHHAFLGFFFLALGVLYFIVSFLASKMNSTDKALNFYMPGIAIVFVSLALPVQLSGYWISVAWIIEAVLLYAVSFVAFRDSMRVFGAIVYTLGVLRFFTVDLPQITDLVSFIPIFNKYFFIVLLAILGAYAIAFCYKKAISPESKDSFKKGVAAFIIVAQVLTVYLGIFEIMAHYSKREALYERDFWKSMEVYGEYRTGGYVSCGYRNRFCWSTQSYNEYHQYRPPASQRLDSNGQYIYTPPAQPDERTQSEINTRCAEREAKFTAMSNQRNLWVSIFLVLYAVLLAVAGFVFNVRLFRLLGILLFFITAFKIFTDVWSLGQVYRIISSITFGVLALAISFVYTKWKSRLKEIL